MKHSLGRLAPDVVVERARSAISLPIAYKLGAGGRDPRAKTPGAECDCSGFVAWCLGVDRYLPRAGVPTHGAGDWLECSALWRDARSPYGFTAEVEPDMARIGDLLVYPDSGGRQGHVGVVSEVDSDGPTRVVHCSSGNYKSVGRAVRETGVEVFKLNRALVARVAWVQ